jgi:hypothetical protein
MAGANPEHRGRMAAEAGRRIKALLTPLEQVCRYREQLSEDMAIFEVRSAAAGALPFSIAIAPGGINVDCAAFAIRELPLEEADVAVNLAEAIIAGRVRQVRQLRGNGQVRSAKSYCFDATGKLIFRTRKSAYMAQFQRPARLERVRFKPYA